MTRLIVLSLVALPFWPRIVDANRALLARMEAFERRLEQEATIGRALRPYAQWLLAGVLGAGNERVYPGRDGWLFYRPDVEYVTGRGFLEEREFERRVLSASEWTTPPQPDPVRAIVEHRARRHADAGEARDPPGRPGGRIARNGAERVVRQVHRRAGTGGRHRVRPGG
jgi:hypothetical protein